MRQIIVFKKERKRKELGNRSLREIFVVKKWTLKIEVLEVLVTRRWRVR